MSADTPEKQFADYPTATTGSERRVFLVVVDETEEMELALRFACGRAANTGGRVALLHVLEPNDFQNWMAVGDLMRHESRAEAEKLLQRYAAKAQAAESPVTLQLWPNMLHVWQMFGDLPETDEAFERVGEFLLSSGFGRASAGEA